MSLKRLLFVSKSKDPFFNLAYENWIIQDLHKTAGSPKCLFIYQNRPSIIIGRNQNIWAECNINKAKSLGIPVLRRFSGGGCVYHDLGNVNYSLHCDKSDFNRTCGAELVIKALKPHTNNLFLSPRHDIFIKTNEGSTAKVSGSAYKLTRDRAYHHGTLLLSADLRNIEILLKSPLNILKSDDKFKFGGVSSVPSPVSNIPGPLAVDKFLELIIKEFDPTDPIIYLENDSGNDSMICNDAIKKGYKELQSWDWIFGKSPPFKALLSGGFEIVVENGIIKEISDPALLNKPLDEVV